MGDRRRVRIVLAYDGTAYAGWQVQPRRPTVQGVLQEALATLHGGRPASVRGAGRTDAGVHAVGQVADAEVDLRMDDDRLLHALRAVLPHDVRPLEVETVPDRFHSRRDARAKTYVYLVDRSAHGDPFLARHALHVPRALDLEAMRDALERLPGRRDWTGFTAASCEIEDRVRTLAEASYEEDARRVGRFRFRADGFLTYMVRNLVGTVLDVGAGRFPPERVDDVLRTGDRAAAGPTARAHGLFLRRVEYDDHDGPADVPWPGLDRTREGSEA